MARCAIKEEKRVRKPGVSVVLVGKRANIKWNSVGQMRRSLRKNSVNLLFSDWKRASTLTDIAVCKSTTPLRRLPRGWPIDLCVGTFQLGLNKPNCNRLLSSPPPDPVSPLFRRLLPRSEHLSLAVCVLLHVTKFIHHFFAFGMSTGERKKVLCIWWLTRLSAYMSIEQWHIGIRVDGQWTAAYLVPHIHTHPATHGPNESNKRIIIIYATEYEITQYFSFFFLLSAAMHRAHSKHTRFIIYGFRVQVMDGEEALEFRIDALHLHSEVRRCAGCHIPHRNRISNRLFGDGQEFTYSAVPSLSQFNTQ